MGETAAHEAGSGFSRGRWPELRPSASAPGEDQAEHRGGEATRPPAPTLLHHDRVLALPGEQPFLDEIPQKVNFYKLK